MSKLNLDELIQQKLNQLEVPHKPEYWTQMEEELETAAPIGVGGIGSSLSRIYTITGIATSVVVISIIAYFSFKNNTDEISKPNILTTIVNTESVALNDENSTNIEKNKQYQNSVEKSIVNESSKEITTSKEESSRILDKNTKTNTSVSNIKKTANNSRNKNIINKEEITASTSAQIQQKSSVVIKADPIEIDDYNNLVNYNPRNIIKSEFPNNEESVNETNVCNELIVIKPINKPSKSVFKKRRGILYRLGIRK